MPIIAAIVFVFFAFGLGAALGFIVGFGRGIFKVVYLADYNRSFMKNTGVVIGTSFLFSLYGMVILGALAVGLCLIILVIGIVIVLMDRPETIDAAKQLLDQASEANKQLAE